MEYIFGTFVWTSSNNCTWYFVKDWSQPRGSSHRSPAPLDKGRGGLPPSYSIHPSTPHHTSLQLSLAILSSSPPHTRLHLVSLLPCTSLVSLSFPPISYHIHSPRRSVAPTAHGRVSVRGCIDCLGTYSMNADRTHSNWFNASIQLTLTHSDCLCEYQQTVSCACEPREDTIHASGLHHQSPSQRSQP